MSEQEIVDPRPQLEKECHPACVAQWKNYEACKERITKNPGDGLNCAAWAYDYWSCVDKCVAPKLFAQLK